VKPFTDRKQLRALTCGQSTVTDLREPYSSSGYGLFRQVSLAAEDSFTEESLLTV
jgi:hypothetical protein